MRNKKVMRSMRSTHRMPRRSFLHGMGAMIPLPLLEPMLARSSSGGRRSTAPRLGMFYFPNGATPGDWDATTDASGKLVVPQHLEAQLGSVAGDLTWINGLDNRKDGRGDHERATASFANCADMLFNETPNKTPLLSRTADQIIADQIGDQYPLRTLNVSAPGFQNAGAGFEFVAICLNHMSWQGGDQPTPKLQSPRQVFDKLFPTAGDGSEQEAQKRRAQKRSILDYSLSEANALATQVGTGDRLRLEQYFESIRELEHALDQDGPNDACMIPDAPDEIEYPFEVHNQLMYDLVFVAFQCELTPVVTFLMDFEFSGRRVDYPGITGGHHQVSHHGGAEASIAQMRLYNQFYADRFAKFVGKLKSANDVDGVPLLDTGAYMLCSGCGESNGHSRQDLQITIAGKFAGQIEPGRRIVADVPLANLFRSLMLGMGASGPPVDEFGDNTGVLDELRE